MNRELKQLQQDIEEANERIEVLGDANHLLDKEIVLNIFGVEYEANTFDLLAEDREEPVITLTFRSWNVGNYYPELEVSKEFFLEYLYKLRRHCEQTNTFTFEEAEPEEYKAAKEAEEAMKHPDFKECFEYSLDQKYDTMINQKFIDRANEIQEYWSQTVEKLSKNIHDTQEIWWQQQGEE